MNVVGANAFQDGFGSLRGANDGEFSDKVIFASLVDGLELCGAGMGEMMEIEGVGNYAFQATLWSLKSANIKVVAEVICISVCICITSTILPRGEWATDHPGATRRANIIAHDQE